VFENSFFAPVAALARAWRSGNLKPLHVLASAATVEDLRKERASEVIDRDYAQANETWNMLAHQVVGQERF